MLWTDFLRKMNPSKQQAIQESENVMIATQKIKKSLSDMEKKQESLDGQIKTLTVQISALAKKGDKRTATASLLKRRRLIAQQTKIFNTIFALETQLDTIDATETNTSLLEAFKSSSSAFKNWKDNNPIKNTEDVEAIKQDLEDQIQNSNEILDIVSQPINVKMEDVTLATENIEIEDILKEIDECEEVQEVNVMKETKQQTLTVTPETVQIQDKKQVCDTEEELMES